MTAFTLISHALCPYVQRAQIASTEKNIDFARTDIDLANKPDWFLKISPTGKVPVLQTKAGVVFESAVILEYIEDTTPTPMHPCDPFERAQHRAWMAYGSSILANIAGMYAAKDKEAFNAKVQALRQQFIQIEAVIPETSGPFFAGKPFMLIDAVYAPIFRYFDLFDKIDDFGILSDLPKLAKWRKSLAARPSVVSAVAPDYLEKLREFIIARDSYLGARAQTQKTPQNDPRRT